MSGAIIQLSKKEKIIALVISGLFLSGTIYLFWHAFTLFAASGVWSGLLFVILGIITLIIALVIAIVALIISN